jgi:CubicO group peptidase (beta-lactamase class C family)
MVKTFWRTLVTGLSASVLSQTALAQSGEDAAAFATLSADLDALLEDSGTVGFSAAVTNGDEIIWSYAYGETGGEASVPITPDTPFRVGSVTKTVTALAVLKLVDEGILDLNAPISTYWPDALFTNAWEDTHPVTLAHLLEHTSGWDDLHFREYLDYPADMSLEDGLQINPQSRTSRWRPGLVSSYSNAGPSVAGRIIEIVTGRRYGEYVEAEILRPLGMEAAGFDGHDEYALPSFSAEGVKFAHHNIWADPAGGLSASAAELAQVLEALMNDGAPLISAASHERMQTPSTSLTAEAGIAFGEGLGLYVRYRSGHRFHSHSGAIDGYQSQMGYLPEIGLGYVALINTNDGSAFSGARRMIFDALTRDMEAHAPAEVQDLPDLPGIEGFYRPGTTRNHTFFALDRHLGPATIAIRDGALVERSLIFGDETVLWPVGGARFAVEDAPAATHAVIATERGYVIATPTDGAMIQVSAMDALAPILLMGGSFLAAVIAILALAVTAIVRIFRKFSLKNQALLWGAPALAGVSYGAFLIILIGTLNTFITMIPTFGQIGVTSVGLFLLSFGLPVFALVGLAVAILSRSQGIILRSVVGVLCVLQVSYAVTLFGFGWIGFTSWAAPVPTYAIGSYF